MTSLRFGRFSLKSLFLATTLVAALLGYWRWRCARVIRQCEDIYAQGIAITMIDGTPPWWPSILRLPIWARRPGTAWVNVTRVRPGCYRFGLGPEEFTLTESQARIDAAAERLRELGTSDVQLWMLDASNSGPSDRYDPLETWSMTERSYNGGMHSSPEELEEFYRRTRP